MHLPLIIKFLERRLIVKIQILYFHSYFIQSSFETTTDRFIYRLVNAAEIWRLTCSLLKELFILRGIVVMGTLIQLLLFLLHIQLNKSFQEHFRLISYLPLLNYLFFHFLLYLNGLYTLGIWTLHVEQRQHWILVLHKYSIASPLRVWEQIRIIMFHTCLINVSPCRSSRTTSWLQWFRYRLVFLNKIVAIIPIVIVLICRYQLVLSLL